MSALKPEGQAEWSNSGSMWRGSWWRDPAAYCECCSGRDNLQSIDTEHPSDTGTKHCYSDIIRICFSIEICMKDQHFICTNCVESLLYSYDFKLRILQTQKTISEVKKSVIKNDYQTNLLVEDFSQSKCEKIIIKNSSSISNSSQQNVHNNQKKTGRNIKTQTNTLTGKFPKLPNQGRNLPYQLDRNSLTCQICETKFMKFKELQNHMPVHFPDFICHVCGRLFPNEFHLKIHQKCHQRRDLKCEHCEQMFKTKGTLQQHVNIIHLGVKKKFKCFSCDECFPTYYLRVKHMIEKHGMEGKKFKCEMCSRQFHIANHMQEHIRKQHLNIRPFSCDKCSYKGHTNWALKQHYVTHTGEKKFSCDVCFKTYGRRNTLQEHMKMHKDNPEQCLA